MYKGEDIHVHCFWVLSRESIERCPLCQSKATISDSLSTFGSLHLLTNRAHTVSTNIPGRVSQTVEVGSLLFSALLLLTNRIATYKNFTIFYNCATISKISFFDNKNSLFNQLSFSYMETESVQVVFSY